MQNSLFGTPAAKSSKPITAEFNPDGYSVKGCSFIYAPAGQAGEYSQLATNPYRGCGHKCAYCYVPQVIKMDRAEFDSGATPRPNFLINLMKDANKYQLLGSTSQVMLSFTTDVYNPFDTSLTRPTIEVLKINGLAFSVLTKGGSRALVDLNQYRPDRDAFASTLTSLDDSFSLKWERGAALPGDRISTLQKFHDAGIFTWVSCEPTLDVEATLAIIESTRSFVDFFKIGRVNYVGLTKTTDWESFTHKVVDLCQKYGIKHYIKKDLQQYLPAGYPNEKIIPQHN
jgi:DNA repair photolyase